MPIRRKRSISAPSNPALRVSPLAAHFGHAAFAARFRQCALVLLLAVLFPLARPTLWAAPPPPPPPPPIGESASEEDVKAALLTKLPIPMFVEWPGKQDPNSQVVIGVVGDNRLIRSLENILQSRAGGRPMTVRAIRTAADVEGCQMLYISRSQKKAAEFLAVAKRGILTIGDAEGFAKNGGMIGFFVADSNINFEVNLGAANQAGITLGSRLLKLAKAVIQ